VVEPGPGDIVFEGDLDEVNRFFYENDWSDGLPIVPPTLERVAAFLRFADRPAETELGVLLPDKRRATVWNVAVNGVMAGCRPEYMPILVALIEAMADPRYGVEHSGNTPGAETLIILNGPIIKELGFNYEQGALRTACRPTPASAASGGSFCATSPAFHHRTDKGTFGNYPAWYWPRTRTRCAASAGRASPRMKAWPAAATRSRSRGTRGWCHRLGIRQHP
jgi:hypothetical protein